MSEVAAAESAGYGLLIVGSVVKGATSGLVTKYLDRVVNPFLRGVSGLKIQGAIKKNTFRYIKGVEYRTRTLPSIAIPSGVFQLEAVYEPLTVRSENDGTCYKIDAYPRDLFAHSRCVALTDDAGMGKSTLAKFIVRAALNEGRNIPLLVELRRMRAGAKILDALCFDLAGGDSSSPGGGELIKLFASGNFLFVFDGYDELDEDIRGEVTEEINLLAAQFGFCYFLLTSRKEYGSALFPEFAHFEICKLTEDQAHSLIRRYDQNRGLAKALISKIDEANVDEFLGNPLLVTLLYRAFDFRPAIPPKRGIFFRQVYEALFQDHDLSKGGSFERKKQCSLDIDDFHRFLRALGFITFRSGRVSYSPEEFCEHLKDAVERSSLTVDWQKIKLDLVRAVPLFAKDGVDYRWSHKSFQEYFAAQYIAIDLAATREEVLRKIFNSDDITRFREVLRFIAEADISLVRDVYVEPLLSSIFAKGMSDDQFGASAMLQSADVFYVGDFGEEGTLSNRSSLQRVVHSRLGVDTSDRITRSLISRPGGYAILIALNRLGVRLVLLPVLDPELFRSGKRSDDLAMFRFWYQEYGQGVLYINDELKSDVSQFALRALSSVTQIPLLTNDIYNRVVNAKNRRSAAIESSVLDGF